MRKIKFFILGCLISILLSCNPRIAYNLKSYTNIFTTEQIDSIYIVEQLPKTGWVNANIIDAETQDTIISKAYYKDLSKSSNDSVVGIKYLYRKVDTLQYFTKQLIIDKKKTNK